MEPEESELIPDVEKLKNAEKFFRRGGTRRQDHATRGNSHRGDEYDPWSGSKEEDMFNLRERKNAQQGGLIELD